MSQNIRNVKDMDSLISYLSENLGWNIDLDDFDDIDDITYDFDADDLGLKEEAFAKISSLKQLRPLVDDQKWGIFLVDFDSKKFEVTALRKILSGLVPTRRNSSEHAVWDKHDLLFLCTWGDHNHVTLGAAHFEDSEKGLPQIKMISCEPAVEDITQISIFERRLGRLKWPDNPEDQEKWKDDWRNAFRTSYRQTIRDSQTLVTHLSEEARNIRDRILETLEVETSKGYVHKLYEEFKSKLIHDMTEQQFADTYAQTIVYGLFSARCMGESANSFDISQAVDAIPNTNPFLKGLMQECLGTKGSTNKLTFDELEVGSIIDLLMNTQTETIVEDFNRQTGGGREDPVIHFYEEFLTEYDKSQKVQRGVFYTPQPVVNFMVRAVDDLLKTEFGIEDGLASTSTKKIKYIRDSKKKRYGVITDVEDEKEVPAIQVLDPATGTGTFLRQIILQIHKNFEEKNSKLSKIQRKEEWNKYVEKHLLPRLNGFELMMAPYAVAHMKLAMVLKDTGYEFNNHKRLQVYLTNTLEEPGDDQITLFSDPLAIESMNANEAKKNSGINVVIGNPPYSISSTNKDPWILSLLQIYKDGLNERKVNLDDDYIKFIRYGQEILNKSSSGILAFITNNSFLDGITHRKMREVLLNSFNKIIIINLHGNSKRFEKSPDGGKDENVFDIQQGVSINIFVKTSKKKKGAGIYYRDLFGLRSEKYRILNSSRIELNDFRLLSPTGPNYFFYPFNTTAEEEYSKGFAIDEFMKVNSSGIQTKNDKLAIKFNQSDVKIVQDDFLKLDQDDLTKKYSLKDSAGWKIKNAVNDIKTNRSFILPIVYRPFDNRYVLYTNKSSGFLGRPREKVSRYFVEQKNLGLIVRRTTPPVDFTHVFISDSVISEGVLGIDPNGREYIFPLYLDSGNLLSNRAINFDSGIWNRIRSIIGDDHDEMDILGYIYGYLHSEKYRKKYTEYLRVGFPRIPFPKDEIQFSNIASLGTELIRIHLMEDTGNLLKCTFKGMDRLVSTCVYKDGKIFINKTSFFDNVPEWVWNQFIGGYAPLQKWLKLRKNLTITQGDVSHYIHSINAIYQTRKIANKIDNFIEL